MSGFAPLGTFLVGTDLSISITANATGAQVLLDGKRTNFTQKADDTLLKSEVIDNGGLPDHRVIPNGWSGTIDVDRASGDFDALFAFLEANYYAGGAQQYFTITVSTPNYRTGGIDRYAYQGVVFHGYDPGTYTKTTITKVTVNWAAQQRTAA
jgi:hypothetical protein